jgi:hypothetical protein
MRAFSPPGADLRPARVAGLPVGSRGFPFQRAAPRGPLEECGCATGRDAASWTHNTWLVQPAPQQPEFGLILAFLWGDSEDVDTDGDSDSPESRSWTWLYAAHRARPSEALDVGTTEGAERVTRVTSQLPWLAAAAAYFLAREGKVKVRRVDDDEWFDRDALESHADGFDLLAGLARADASACRKWP